MHPSARFRHLAPLAAAGLVLAGCSAADGSASGGDEPALTITSPAAGATVTSPVTLTFETNVPLGPSESGRDHVHVFTDGKTGDYTVVPTNSFEIKDLEPGRHTIGVALQHADHSSAGASTEITVIVSGSPGEAPSGESGTGAETPSPSEAPGTGSSSGSDKGDGYGY